MKNYIVNLINNEEKLLITAQQAALILQNINAGQKCVVIDGNVISCHQIATIMRIDKQSEKDLLLKHGFKKAPLITDFIESKKNNLLT